MAQQPTYNDGTVTVGAGGTTVIGVGTQFNVYPRVGDYFWAQGRSVRIAAIANATQLTLAYGWPGEAITNGNYEIIYTPAQQVAQAKTTALLGQLSNGNLSSIAALTTAANKLAYYSAQGVAALADFSAFGRSLVDDADAAAARTTLGTNDAGNLTTGSLADARLPTRLQAQPVELSDWDSVAAPGFYHSPAGAANAPGSGSSWYGVAVSRIAPGGGATAHIELTVTRIDTSDTDSQTWRRVKISGLAWSAWHRIRRTETELNGLYCTLSTAQTLSGAKIFSLPPRLPSFTVSTLPSASAYSRGLIYVSDGASNKRMAISDGTNWRFPDGAIVS